MIAQQNSVWTRIKDVFRAGGAPGKRNNPVAALIWMTLGVAGLSGLSGFAKYANQQGVDPFLIAFYRNVFCFLAMTPLIYFRGASVLRSNKFSLYWVRVGFQLLSMLCWFPAMAMIPLSDLQATSFLAPLFATILAIVYLRERVPLQRWLALGVGMLGAFIILRPLAPSFGIGQLLALVAAMSIGIGAPLIKQLTATDDADKIVLITNALLVPASLIPALFVWQVPAAHVWPYLLAMGLCACLGHVAMTRAYTYADASLVATFDFARLPFAVLIGLYFFNEKTDVWTWVGSVVIFAAAFYITQSERHEKLRLAALPGDASAEVLLHRPEKQR